MLQKNAFLGIIQSFSLLQVSLDAVATPVRPCRQDVLKLTELELVQGIVHLWSLTLFYFAFYPSAAVSPRYVTHMLISGGLSVLLAVTVGFHGLAM